MIKVRFWSKYFLVALGASALWSLINAILEALYIQNLVETGVDPSGADSTWNPVLAGLYTAVTNGGSAISIGLTISSIGYLLRASQWLKSKSAEAVHWKPGWAIAAPFVPYAGLFIQLRFLNDLNAGGSSPANVKKRTSIFVLGYVVLSFFSASLAAQQLTSMLLGPETVTYDEFLNTEILSLFGLGLDVLAFSLAYYAVRAIVGGIELRAAETNE
ncbi:MAG: hypothetical protein RLZZ06_940 [Actinomycetota bacterium]